MEVNGRRKRILTSAAIIFALLMPSLPYAADTLPLTPDTSWPWPDSGPPSPTASSGGSAKASSALAPGHILVELTANADEPAFLAKAQGLGLRKLKRLRASNWLSLAIPANADPRATAAVTSALPGVIRAVADPLVSVSMIPQDPFYSDDLFPDSNFDPDQWGLFTTDAENAWSVHTGSDQIVIAVVDSGVDLDHDDLIGNIWHNSDEIPNNGLDDDNDGYIDNINGWDFTGDNVGAASDNPDSEDADPNIPEGGTWLQNPTDILFGWWFNPDDPATGDLLDNNGDLAYDIGVFHGTFAAGVAAAMTDNINPDSNQYEGMAGACWNCKIMPVRMLNAEGEGFGSDGAEAIRFAADMGAAVINVSWGVLPGSATADELALLEQAVLYAVSKGSIIVAAAGNSGTPGLHFPASMAETIAVGSSNWFEERSSFSSYADTTTSDVLDVIAPGEYTWSSYVVSPYDTWVLNGWPILFSDPSFDPNDPTASGYLADWVPGLDAYNLANGTSFAAPLVSGYVGLILSQNPCASLADVREIIHANAVDIGATGYDAETGYGRVNMVVPDLNCAPTGNQPPSADAGIDQTVTDSGKPGSESVTLNGAASSDDGTISLYQWQQDDGSVIATGVTVSVSLAVGSHTLTLIVTDDQGLQDNDQVAITVLPKNGGANAAPTASFTVDCTALSCGFDASTSSDSDGSIVSYDWDFGDGNLGSGAIVNHTYANAGRYNVTLTVSDNAGASDTANKRIRLRN